MASLPLLSIVLPCYNVERYLQRCFDSLYDQEISEDEYEIIVVNDCSPDNTRNKVLELQKTHSNIILVDHEINKGLGAARNTGLKRATGDYIWFVDTDDYIESACLRKILKIVESDQIDVLSFNFKKQTSSLQFVKDNVNSTTESRVTNGKVFLEHHYQPSVFSSCSKIYKKVYLQDNQLSFAEGVYWEDADFVVKSIYKAAKVKFIPDHLYYYCYNDQSISRTKSGKKYADMVKMGARKLEFANTIRNESPKLAEAIRRDAIWNASVVKRIIYLPENERKIFYSILTGQEYMEIKSAVNSKFERVLYRFPVGVNACLWFVTPVLIQLKKLKR